MRKFIIALELSLKSCSAKELYLPLSLYFGGFRNISSLSIGTNLVIDDAIDSLILLWIRFAVCSARRIGLLRMEISKSATSSHFLSEEVSPCSDRISLSSPGGHSPSSLSVSQCLVRMIILRISAFRRISKRSLLICKKRLLRIEISSVCRAIA